MNIFVLDNHPARAVDLMCDQHISKMPLETTQLLCTHLREHGIEFDGQYRSTHVNHPCRVWLDRPGALRWTIAHGQALFASYTRWRGRVHKSQAVFDAAVAACTLALVGPPFFPHKFEQCMPEQYRSSKTVAAYRAYYAGEKVKMARYTHNERPEWMPQLCSCGVPFVPDYSSAEYEGWPRCANCGML